ncbi:MAG: hypothetical protein AAGC71_15360, partial [Pseudomonadota bacterium]
MLVPMRLLRRFLTFVAIIAVIAIVVGPFFVGRGVEYLASEAAAGMEQRTDPFGVATERVDPAWFSSDYR